MTDLYMYDAAFAPANLAIWKRPNVIAGSHYVTGSYASSSAQPHALRAIGLGAQLNWERMPAALVGATREHGRNIAVEFLSGLDKDCPRNGSLGAYMSVDVDVPNNTAGYSSCDEGFRGINDVLRPQAGPLFMVKTYGEIGLIEHLVAAGLVQGKQWLSMSEGFSTPGHYGATSEHVCMVQMHDSRGNWIGTDLLSTDRNTITDPHAAGIWWPDNSPYATEDDMSPEDVKKMFDQLAAIRTHQDDYYGDPHRKYSALQLSAKLDRILASVGGLKNGAVDVTELADALAAELGPDIGKQLVTALGTALAATPK